MRGVARILAATAAVVCVSGSAFAADVVIIPPVAPPPVPIVDPPFTGPYWGAFGGYSSEALRGGRRGGMQTGTQFGYNFGTGTLRFGIEIEAVHNSWLQPTVVEGYVNGRVGFVINNNLMIYGQAGIGTLFLQGALNFGGGVEFALNPNLVLFAEAVITRQGLGGPPGGQLLSIRGGVNYYADENNLDAAGNFDWGGLYMGGHGGAIFGGANGAVVGIAGVQVGYNFAGGGPLVFGAEVEVTHPLAPVAVVSAALNGRVGFTFGSILAYGEAGIGSFLGAPVWTIGGGAELALGERLSLFAEVKRLAGFGGVGGTLIQAAGGLNVQFGR